MVLSYFYNLWAFFDIFINKKTLKNHKTSLFNLYTFEKKEIERERETALVVGTGMNEDASP